MAHGAQSLPITGAASLAVQRYGGSDERQEVTEPVPEGGTPIGADVTSSDSTPVAANAARTSVLLQNVSATVGIWLNHGATAAVNQGPYLAPGANVTFVDQRAIHAVTAGGTARLVGYEYTTT